MSNPGNLDEQDHHDCRAQAARHLQQCAHRHRRQDRPAIAHGQSHLLADTCTLYLTTHNVHWNVTGPMFNTLHRMCMTPCTELRNAVDPVAERTRALGHAAPGSYAA